MAKNTKQTEADSTVTEKPDTGAENANANDELAALAGMDTSRPYIIGADRKPIQMEPMDEKIFREDYDDEGEANIAIFEELEKEARKVEDKVARKQVDPGVPDRLRKAPPKSGHTIARIEVHMRQVFSNIIGRRNVDGKYDIAGLYSFGSRVNQLVMGHKSTARCPYASWYLWRIEQEIQQLRQQITQRRTVIDKLIVDANAGIDYEPFTSRAPTIEVLSFNSVHAFQIASVLHQYDEMLRVVWPYVRNHFVSHKDFDEQAMSFAKNIRRLFMLPNTWYYVGMDAVTQKTALYAAAKDKMGEVPVEFVTGDKKPEWV